ncbi:hypothetical protein [Kribbella sp. DT2]|uniref:hypothetical protein n=1 Tax=Kribbella sp. DT2 TaxID=3393427 RepID=UPI003CF58D34
MAAHIYAASPNGPRGSGGLTFEELRQSENGIWCCYDHGKVIDSGGGSVFSAAQLKAWKRLHEMRKGVEIHGLAPDRFGLVESITINSAPVLSGSTFELGMLNFVIGANGTGKTVLGRLLRSVSDLNYVAHLSRSQEVDVAVKWFDPHSHEVSTSGRSGELRQTLDGRRVPYVARPYKTIMPTDFHAQSWSLISLAQQFDLSVTAMASTLRALPDSSRIVREVTVTDSAVEMVVVHKGRTFQVGERGWWDHGPLDLLVFLELVSTHAAHHARDEPTLLILDELFARYNSETRFAALGQVEATAEHVQIAVLTHNAANPQAFGQGWTVTRLPDYSPGDRANAGRPIDLEITATNRPAPARSTI